MKRFFLILFVIACFAAFTAQAATSHDISTGDLSITTGGEWEVTGNTDTYSIKVNTTDDVTIIFENVTIDGAECALDIVKGNVTLIVRGSSLLHSANSAGIRVKSGTSLIIEGEGYIDVHGEGDQNSGIGSRKYENPGSITINSGHVSAYGSPFGAGIGGGGHGNGGTITINGGEIVAEGGTYAAGIGGGTGWEGGAGTITINGGFVRASSDDGAGIGCGDEGGHYTPGTITITGGTIEASSQSGAGIGAGAKSGSSGDVPDIFISGGSIKAYADNPAASPIGPGAGHGSGLPPRTPDGYNVFLATVSGALAGHTDDYTFTTTQDGQPYTYSYTGYGHLGETDLFFYLPNGEYTVKGTNGRDFAGEINEEPGTLTRYIPEKVYLHVGDGDIAIETEIGATQGKRIVGRYGNYVIDGTTTDFSISVNSSDNPTITLDGASITGVSSAFDIQSGDVALVLNGENVLTSTEAAGLRVANGASVTISGRGSLNATSRGGAGAGIGGNSWETSGAIVINGGTITAYGATYAAGIGGGEHAKANVTINGGSVTATAGSFAAGIGGGTGWQGGAGIITIKGGYVKATGGNGAGIGCGDEGGHDSPGTITITGGTIEASAGSGAGIGAGNAGGESGRVPAIYISGGSVLATSDSGSPVGQGAGQGEGPEPLNWAYGEAIYEATLEGATADSILSIFGTGDGEVTFTATRTADGLTYGYEGEGYSDTDDLFFYLPEGEYIITGSNGKTYAGSVSPSGSTITPTPEPAMLGLLALVALCLRRK